MSMKHTNEKLRTAFVLVAKINNHALLNRFKFSCDHIDQHMIVSSNASLNDHSDFNMHHIQVEKKRHCLSGKTSKTAKLNFVKWLANSKYDFAWHFEEDTFYTGNVCKMIQAHSNVYSDLLASNYHDTNFFYYKTCTHCDKNSNVTLWPALRLSKRLAIELLRQCDLHEYGHHEIMASSVCIQQKKWCSASNLLTKSFIYLTNVYNHHVCCRLPKKPELNALYHPVKFKKTKYELSNDCVKKHQYRLSNMNRTTVPVICSHHNVS